MEPPVTRGDRPVFVLVHSPLVGSTTWSGVAKHLERRGHDVVVPRLDNPDRTTGPLFRHHAEQVRRAVEAWTKTAPVVLVGHSGAGPVLPAAGDRMVNEVLAYVFVDAPLPRDQRSRLDDAPPEFAEQLERLTIDGRVAPWAEWWSEEVLAALLPDDEVRERFADELETLPRRLFDETISVPAAWPDAPCAYLRLSQTYDRDATAAARLGWDVRSFDTGHLHMLVDPEAMAGALEGLVADAVGRSPGQRPPAREELAERVDPDDPVAAARARVSHWVDLGRRVGFLSLAVAVTLFTVALYWDLPSVLVQLVVASLVIAGLTLLPALVVGMGVSAAEREDRERGLPPG